ncbi:hypothetical protein Ciccas_005578 [Cichlidogyrus casuarinus]|uniref:Uncharacterized protein n=1 Tax=Cichlidogyrus casuarinus TaxID=1844966 RepID=A0ABD2Q8A8_9PLAT
MSHEFDQSIQQLREDGRLEKFEKQLEQMLEQDPNLSHLIKRACMKYIDEQGGLENAQPSAIVEKVEAQAIYCVPKPLRAQMDQAFQDQFLAEIMAKFTY